MITKINKIKNLGIFKDYTPQSNLRDFKKYNLIYGWNGSGKTTLSKIFDCFENGTHSEFPEIEYEVEDEVKSKYQEGRPFTQNVRVFNQDYIERNIKIREGKARSITLILGDVNKEDVEQIEKDEVDLKKKQEKLKRERDSIEQKDKTKGKTFTEIAMTIYVAVVGGAIRNYRKDNAEADFALLTNKQTLEKDETDKLSIVVKQSPKPIIDQLQDIKVQFTEERDELSLEDAIKEVLQDSKKLLSERVDSIVISKLKENAEISDWIESGLKIHQNHKLKNCEFCTQPLSESRLIDLAKHFNAADRNLKINLDLAIDSFSKIKEVLDTVSNLPDRARFYDEYANEYDTKCVEFAKDLTNILIKISKIQDLLREKKARTTESLDFTETIDLSNFISIFKSLQNFIEAHNKKTADFENSKNEAIKKLKNHYLSTIFDEVKQLEQEIVLHQSVADKLTNGDPSNPDDLGIAALKNRIINNKAKVSSTHKACGDINDALATFLGRRELIFEPHKAKVLDENGKETEIDDGYVIKRNDKTVTSLSEGEKTAIAFVYFTIHLNDPSFNKANGIVVVDDPISSLDSNSLFQAFSFLKNAVKDVGQIFIMTHNFDFLRLILNWFQDRYIPAGEKSFYMIQNKDTKDGRIAFLDELDKDLREHESEYNYLFKILYTFQSNGTIASVYHMPNVARKVLESFLMFRVPNSQSAYQKLESLKHLFDEKKITAIYKFTNDQSHITGKGFDPCLVPETQKVVKYLLELIETTFTDHYKVLTEAYPTMIQIEPVTVDNSAFAKAQK